MSEMINNRETQQGLPEEKKQLLKEIIIDLHKGKPLADVKKRFEKTFGSVNAEEIAQLEQALMKEEGITPKKFKSFVPFTPLCLKDRLKTFTALTPISSQAIPFILL